MLITQKAFADFTKATVKTAQQGKLPKAKEDDFLRWGFQVLKDLAVDDNVDLPVRFQELYREFRKSHEPDADSMLFEAEQRANPRPYKAPANATGESFLQQFGRLTTVSKSAFERLEFTRRGQSETELERAVRGAFKSLEREKRLAAVNPIEAVLAEPETAFYWSTMARFLGGASHLNADESKLVDEMKDLRASICKGLDTTSTLVGFPLPVSTDVFNLLLVYGAFRALGVRPMAGNRTKFAKLTALPNAVFITPTATGANRAIPADTALAGDSITQQCNIIGALVEMSLELVNDEKIDLGSVLLEMFVQGLAARLDFACFQGDGSDDQSSGLQTGIFIDGTIASVAANAGNATLAQLERGDFLSAVGTVAPAALQRPCRWFVNPGMIPTLLTLNLKNAPTAYRI